MVIVIVRLERVETGSFLTLEFAVKPAVMFPQCSLEEANERRLQVVEQECSPMLEQGWEVNQFEAQRVW